MTQRAAGSAAAGRPSTTEECHRARGSTLYPRASVRVCVCVCLRVGMKIGAEGG